MEENCRSCKNNISDGLSTAIFCSYWTPKMRAGGWNGRLPAELRCQHYARDLERTKTLMAGKRLKLKDKKKL